MLSACFLVCGFYKPHEFITFDDFKKLQQPVVEGLGFFSEPGADLFGDGLDIRPAVAQGPDEAAHFVEMDLRILWLVGDFLKQMIHHPFVFDEKGDFAVVCDFRFHNFFCDDRDVNFVGTNDFIPAELLLWSFFQFLFCLFRRCFFFALGELHGQRDHDCEEDQGTGKTGRRT